MDVREKLIEILRKPIFPHELVDQTEAVADYLLDSGVTVQEHGYLETVVEVMDNTVCGNGVKIEYKRCSCCKNPSKNFEDVFCGNCGAKLDLQEPPKGGVV